MSVYCAYYPYLGSQQWEDLWLWLLVSLQIVYLQGQRIYPRPRRVSEGSTSAETVDYETFCCDVFQLVFFSRPGVAFQIEQPLYFKCVVLLLLFQKSNGQQNSQSVEFWWNNIQGNLRRANAEPSMHFRWASTKPSLEFRKAKMELSIHFKRTKFYQKQNVNLIKRAGGDKEVDPV